MAEVRLDKIIADTGRFTRKEAKLLLRAGRVSVNGVLVRSAEEKYDPEAMQLAIDGGEVTTAMFHYLLLYKPAGVLTATEDRRQKTVLDLLDPTERRMDLFPVGRLDKDTTGLLLLTDDGPLAHRLLSPKYHVPKRYLATINGRVDAADVSAFAQGICLADGEQCLPAELADLGDGLAAVTLWEGKYHQVKRMLASRGKPVLALHRETFGPLRLDPEMQPGDYRPLSREEIALLRTVSAK